MSTVTSVRDLYILDPRDNRLTLEEIEKQYGKLARSPQYSLEPKESRRCGDKHEAGWICTVTKGHSGPHEAHITWGVAVGPTWYDTAMAHKICQRDLPSYLKYYKQARPAKYYNLSTMLPGNKAAVCGKSHTAAGSTFTCTLVHKHKTPHEAHFTPVIACCEPWEETATTEVADVKAVPVNAGILTWGTWKANGGYKKTPAIYDYAAYKQCGKTPKSEGYVCTREADHDGPHEAHYSRGQACGPCWTDVDKP